MGHFYNKIIKGTIALFCLFIMTSAVQAQVNTYSFTASVANFNAIAGQTILPVVSNKFDTILTPMFSFNNQDYNSIVISSNGFLIVGDNHAYTTSNATPISATFAASGIIAPFARTLEGASTNAAILYEVIGSEIVVQWTEVKRTSVSNENLTFQVRIDTISNYIKFVYGNMMSGNASSHAQVGLRGSAATDYHNLTILNVAGKSWLAPERGTSASATAVLRADGNNVLPVSGLTYTWVPATCFAPNGFVNTNATTTSLAFAWDNTIVEGEIAIFPTATSLANATFIPVSGTSAIISNLDVDTKYSVQIREICAVGDSSAWTTVLTAKTACDAITTLPWTEDFEGILANTSSSNLLGALPNTCWSHIGDITGAKGVQSAARRARSGTKYLTTNYNTNANTGDAVYTPGFQLEKDTSYTFSFWYKADGRTWDTVRALVGTVQNALQMQVIGAPVYAFSDSADYVRYFAEFVPTSSGVYYFGANVFAGALVTNFMFDDFKVEKTPTCPELYPVTFSNITARTADITWTTNNAVEIVLIGASETIAEGTILPLPNNTNTYTLTDLLPGRSYKVYVRQICAVGDTSNWSTAAIFQTSCAVLTAPWFEDFENTLMQVSTSNPIPSCWAKTGDFKGDNVTGNYNRAAISGNNYVYTQFNTLATTGDRLFTPTFELEAGKTYTFAFWYAKQNNAGKFDSIQVAVTTDQLSSNIEILGTVGELNGTVGATQFQVDFTPTTSGQYSFLLSVFATTSPWYLVFDDFSLTENCTPATLTLNTTNSCDMNSGIIATTVTGGTAPFTYLWSSGATDSVITNAVVGVEYTVTATDAAGCIQVASAIVGQFPQYAIAPSTTNATCPTCIDGTATLIVLNAVAPTFIWSNGDTTQNLTAVEAGEYTVTVSDINGCTKEITITIAADAIVDGGDDDEIAVDETQLANTIKMYPNPTSQMVTLEGFNVTTALFVVNNLGQIVLQTIVDNAQIQLDLSHLAPSTYFIRLQSEKGNAVLPLIKAE